MAYLPGTTEDIQVMAEVLDSLGIALCLFDHADCTLLWNRTFLRFFPEHDGYIHAGEHYRENLIRFYQNRLRETERPHLDQFVKDGITRHRTQHRPFTFEHRGRRLHVASLPLAGQRRVRVWTEHTALMAPVAPLAAASTHPNLFEHIADGAMVMDRENRITAANQEFAALYDVAAPAQVVGLTFVDVLRNAWSGRAGTAGDLPPAIVAMIDSARFAGAAFEVELPGDRWRRVLERRAIDGTGYISHADITELKRQQRELRLANVTLERMTVTDSLTGIANRRHFETVLATEAQRAAQAGVALSLLLIDLDAFKQLNDRFGHGAGDEGLGIVANTLRDGIRRPHDLAARLGGDEFACILPCTDSEQAAALAERLRQAVREATAGFVPLTISIGVACMHPLAGVKPNVTQLVRAADTALYEAKRLGGNQVSVAPLPGAP